MEMELRFLTEFDIYLFTGYFNMGRFSS